jgi:hypothetical protein
MRSIPLVAPLSTYLKFLTPPRRRVDTEHSCVRRHLALTSCMPMCRESRAGRARGKAMCAGGRPEQGHMRRHAGAHLAERFPASARGSARRAQPSCSSCGVSTCSIWRVRELCSRMADRIGVAPPLLAGNPDEHTAAAALTRVPPPPPSHSHCCHRRLFRRCLHRCCCRRRYPRCRCPRRRRPHCHRRRRRRH